MMTILQHNIIKWLKYLVVGSTGCAQNIHKGIHYLGHSKGPFILQSSQHLLAAELNYVRHIVWPVKTKVTLLLRPLGKGRSHITARKAPKIVFL